MACVGFVIMANERRGQGQDKQKQVVFTFNFLFLSLYHHRSICHRLLINFPFFKHHYRFIFL